MRVLFYISGSLLILLGAIIQLAILDNGIHDHVFSAAALGLSILFAGIALITAAVKRYRGSWQFLLGLLMVVFPPPFISVLVTDYLAELIQLMSLIIWTGIFGVIAVIGIIFLALAHKKHIRTPIIECTPDIKPVKTYAFNDYPQLQKVLKYALFAYIAIFSIGFASNIMQFQLMSDFHDGVYHSKEKAIQDATANDQRQTFISRIEITTAVFSSIVFLLWTYRASANAHSLSKLAMEYTPLSAVAWYFVPFANIWHPYQAMKEIWLASYRPDAWKNAETHYILPVWWGVYMFSNVLGWWAIRQSYSAGNDIAKITATTITAAGSQILTIIWAASTIVLIGQIRRLQVTHAPQPA